MIEGSSGAPEVPGLSQPHSGGAADPLPARPDAGEWARTRVAAECAHSKNCHSAAPASNTKATSSHCVQPNPFIPFSPACIATKAQKLGSCVDDRVTNLFGETHCTGRLYSSAAERGELNMDMQRWVSLCTSMNQQCPAITPGIIHTFHMGQMPRPDV